jgi:ribosomal protein S6
VKTYEITYLTVLEEGSDAKSIAPVLSHHEAKIISVHPWGTRRKLTYPIKKQDQAFYTTVVFDSTPSSIAPIQQELQLSNDILRTLIVEFEPGIFHRTAPSEEAVKVKPVEKAEKSESEVMAVTNSVSSPTESKETKPVLAGEEKDEGSKSEIKTKAKPRRSAKKTSEEQKSLDEKLDALLNEDITK